jgi:hypothetical protein
VVDAGTGAIDIDADVTATLEQLTSTVGDITVTAGDVVLNGTISSAGALTLEPIAAATTIGLGGGAGDFSVDDSELANLTNGFSGITIGKADAGDMTIDTTTFQDPVSLITAGVIRDASGADIAASTNAVTLRGTVAPDATGGGTAGILNVTGNLTLAANDTVEIELGGKTPGEAATNHDQIDVTGTVTIGSNVTLTTSVLGAFSPVGGDEFVIINNDSNDAVTGTFNGLAEGAKIPNFLGSGRSGTVSYVGGDGNDVTITGDGFFVSIDGAGNLVITDNAGTADAVTIQADPSTSEYVITHTSELIGNLAPSGSGGGTMVARVPFSDVTGSQIIANLDGGDDSLNVDYTLGGAAGIPFGKSITLNGGETGETNGDKLFITGNTAAAKIASGAYTPSTTVEAGQHVLTLFAGGPETISFTQLELSNQISAIPSYTLTTGGSNDVLAVAAETLGGPIAAATVTGTTDLVPITPLTVFDVASFGIDTGTNDTFGGGAGNDSVTVNSGLNDVVDLAQGLLNFSVDTGAAGTAGNVDSVTTNAVIHVPGSVTIDNAETVDLNSDVEAGTSLTISNVETEIDLAQDVDLTAENGDLDLNTAVALIDLSGAAGTNNLIANDTGGAADGNISVGPISDSETPAALVVDADNAVAMTSADVQSTITVLANQDGAGAEGFSQTGDIATMNDTAAAVSITVNTGGGGSGSAVLGAVSAGTTSGPAGGRIAVTANGGAITDGNGATNNLTAGNAVLSGTTGVGLVADPIETTLSRLEALGGTGGVFVTNSNSLSIGGISMTVGVSSGVGNIDVRTSNGTLTVEENITSTGAGNILLKSTDTAGVGDDLTVNAGVTISTNTGSINIQAGDNVTLVATSQLNAPGGTIAITGDSDDADAGVGSILTIAAELDSTGTALNGGGDDDSYDFFYPASVTNSGTATISDTGGTDTVMIHGTAAAEDLYLTTTDPPTTATTEQVTRGTTTAEPIIIPADVEGVTLLGGDGNDIFHVEPSMLWPVTVDGGNPSFGDPGVPPGDQLDLETFSNTFTIVGKTIFVANGTPNPYQGITFLDIETVPLTPASAGPDQSFDFNDFYYEHGVVVQSPTQAGATGVTANTVFTPGGFGWQRSMQAFDT